MKSGRQQGAFGAYGPVEATIQPKLALTYTTTAYCSYVHYHCVLLRCPTGRRVTSAIWDLLQTETTAYSIAHGNVNQLCDDYYIVVYIREKPFKFN